MCLVNPYENLRAELRDNNEDKVVEIYLQSDRELRREYHVEDFEIGELKHVLRTDMSIEESWKNLKEVLNLQC